MKKSRVRQDLPYILAVIILGSLCHFVYEWSGKFPLAALFCPVNESVWEHLKLLFFPYLLVITYRYDRKGGSDSSSFSTYYCSHLLAVLLGMLSIIVLFYTYTGIVGQHFLIADILTFIFSVFLSFLSAHAFADSCRMCKDSPALVIIGWVFLTLCFFVFTYYPPDIPLFYSPV